MSRSTFIGNQCTINALRLNLPYVQWSDNSRIVELYRFIHSESSSVSIKRWLRSKNNYQFLTGDCDY